jgi:uncharacterized RDD family membrane protein YckC
VAICPKCGKEQVSASAFCGSCGALLDKPDTSAPPPHSEVVQPTQVLPPSAQAATDAPAAQRDEFGDIGQYIARRLFALLVDLIGVTALLGVAVGYKLERYGHDPHQSGAFFEACVYTLFALIVYLVLSEAYAGTTLGKALFGLRVAVVGGGPVGISRALIRNVFLPFDLLIVGFVLAVLTPRRRRIGDFVAGTEVINTNAPVLAPAIAIGILALWGYAEYAYADGLRTAQTLSNSAEVFGPALLSGQPPPAAPEPLPDRTPVPTEQPITVPTLEPTETPTARPGAASPSAAPSPSPTTAPSPTPAPAATTS